jgi:IclR family acetate operon transcriptional repressor
MAERDSSVQSVERALQILDALDDAGGRLGVSDLAAQIGLPASTIHRLLRTMAGAGYLRQLPDRRYALGSRLAALGMRATEVVGGAARPLLRSLAQRFGESANLAVLAGREAEYVAQVPGTHSMRMFTEVGRRVPLHSTGVGKALLSLLEPGEADDLLRREGMSAATSSTITSRDAMHAELDRIRADGFAIDDGEMEIGVRCVAVPVPGAPPLAVSISGPSSRVTEDRVPEIAAALRDAARRLA